MTADFGKVISNQYKNANIVYELQHCCVLVR